MAFRIRPVFYGRWSPFIKTAPIFIQIIKIENSYKENFSYESIESS